MTEELLKALKSAEGYCSGKALGEALGVSRAAVWKGIEKLRQQGFSIDAVTNKGYKLLKSGDLLCAEEIKIGLKTQYLGQELFLLEEVDSTNLEVKRLAERGAKEGTVVVAKKQTAGRARLGRTWQSPLLGGIFMSMLLKPEISPQNAPILTLLAGIAVCQAIRNKTGLFAQIKWPNDILLSGKKICGILAEMHAEMDTVHDIIIGIGINANIDKFPEELEETATSLAIAAGREFCRQELIQEVLLEFEKYYEQYKKNPVFLDFAEVYQSLCDTIGRQVQVLGRSPFFGMACGVAEDGALLVQKETGEVVAVSSGEVSIRSRIDSEGEK